MYCHKCGAENPPSAQSCLVCGAAVEAPAPQPALTPNPPGVAPPQAFASVPPVATGTYGAAAGPAENTSGWGSAYPLPAEAQGWSFVGLVPFGLFPMYNGMHSWGVAGLLLTALGFFPLLFIIWPLQLGYMIYIGMKGKELAWRSRRFAALSDYQQTMQVWNVVGIAAGVIGAILLIVSIWYYFNAMSSLPFCGEPGAGSSS